MIKMQHYRDSRRAFSDLLNFADMIAPGVMLNKDGSLTIGFEVVPFDTTDENLRRSSVRSSIVSRAVSLLGSGFTLHIDQKRELARYSDKFATSDYEVDFAQEVELESHEMRCKHRSFTNINTLYLTYTPPSVADEKVQSLFKKNIQKHETEEIGRHVRIIEDKAEEFIGAISVCYQRIDRLGPYTIKSVVYDSFLENINAAVSTARHAMVLPNPPTFIDTVVAKDCYGGVELKIENLYYAVVTVSQYPDDTSPELLHALDSLGIEYRWSSRFMLLSRNEAKALLTKTQKKWRQKIMSLFSQIFNSPGPVNHDANQMANELDVAIAKNESGEISFGYYTPNIILTSDNRNDLEKKVTLVKKIVNSAGFVAYRETINLLEAYLGSLPGHTIQNIRRPIIHSLNLADMIPARRIYEGEPKLKNNNLMPKNSPPLSYCLGIDGGPFWFSNFVADVGNMFCFGPTGAGKTYFLAHIALSYLRYKNAKIFIFDKGRSLLGVTRACKGAVYDVGSSSEEVYFNPLSRIRESEKEFEWAFDWLSMLMSEKGGQLSADEQGSLRNALTLLRNVRADVPRISSLIKNLDRAHLKTLLRPYTEGFAGRLLNSNEDAIDISVLTSFELEKLVDKDHKLAEPVLSYLFHVIERSLDGSPVLVVLDEAWVFIKNPLFRAKIEEYLATFRKSCASVVFATQSLAQANSSTLINLIAESCPVKIALPNPHIQDDDAEDTALYAKMGFTREHLMVIKNATQKRDYFFRSINGTRLFNLFMGAKAHAICSATGTSDTKRIANLYREYGDLWINKFYREKGVSYEKSNSDHIDTAAIKSCVSW